MTENCENPSVVHRMMMWIVPVIKWVENRLYINYVRNLMKDEHFNTAIIYSDVAAETAIRAIDADKFLMFYHHGAMRHVYHDEIAYKKCENIIAVSENQANELKKFIPMAANKIVSIHNLTDADGIRQKAAWPIKETFDETRFNIVSVGRVSHEKGMDIAVRVCAKLVKAGYKDVRWWIVGSGPAMQEVEDTITETHMEDYVITVGMQSNPYPYIRQADLYVQPSRVEGYPMTILEALILGQPVVSTDNNGAKEIIKNTVTGILLPIDVDIFTKTVESLLLDGSILQKLKKNVACLDFDKQNFESISMLEKLL